MHKLHQEVSDVYGEISVIQTRVLLLISKMQDAGVDHETIVEFEHQLRNEIELKRELRTLQGRRTYRLLIFIDKFRYHR